MATINSEQGGSELGWQGDGVDVEVQRVGTGGARCYLWVLYDRAREINSGLRRTARGAAWAGQFAAWRYRTFTRRA